MGTSLQEQLLQAGLADKKKLRQVTQEKRQQAKQQKANPKTVTQQTQQALAHAVTEKQARDRALNQQKQAAAKIKEQAAQIKQIIEQHQITAQAGDIAYHFTVDNKVKRLDVTPQIQQQLAQGRLAITAYQNSYVLIPVAVVAKIQQRDPTWFIYLAQTQEISADDPYAAYTVPDNLMW
jgi:uncharacterized protein